MDVHVLVLPQPDGPDSLPYSATHLASHSLACRLSHIFPLKRHCFAVQKMSVENMKYLSVRWIYNKYETKFRIYVNRFVCCMDYSIRNALLSNEKWYFIRPQDARWNDKIPWLEVCFLFWGGGGQWNKFRYFIINMFFNGILFIFDVLYVCL